MRKYALPLVLALLAATAQAEDAYFAGWGTTPAMPPAVQTLLSAASFVSDGVNYLIDGSPIDHWTMRLLKIAAIDYYLIFELLTVNHEFIGHGLRSLEYGHGISQIIINFPGFGGSFVPETLFRWGDPPISRMLFCAGGLEASTLFAHEAKKLIYSGGQAPLSLYTHVGKQMDIFINAYFGQTLDPRQYPNDFLKGDTMLYLVSLTEKAGYYSGTLPLPAINFPGGPPGPAAFINDFLIDLYTRARVYALFVFLDPSLYTSLYTLAKYIIDGEEQFEPVMFNAWGVKFMPGVRVAYGEFGPEVYLDCFGNCGGVSFDFYLREGGNRDYLLLGCGAEVGRIELFPSFFLRAAVDVWSGPKLNARLGCTWMFVKNLGLSADIGAKTKGYLMGTHYDAGFYFYGGMRLVIEYAIPPAEPAQP